jgi:hypothetical protein
MDGIALIAIGAPARKLRNRSTSGIFAGMLKLKFRLERMHENDQEVRNLYRIRMSVGHIRRTKQACLS